MFFVKVVDSVKNIIIGKLMNYIKVNSKYSNKELKEIEYGLTGIYLTISKIIIISIIAYFIGIFKEMMIFMLFFNIIRTTAFGLHATKSWICLLTSLITFLGIPLICKYLNINIFIKYLVGVLNISLIYLNAPADTKNRPIVNNKRRKKLKLISTFISIIFIISCILVDNNFISNCLLFSLILENILISPLTYKIFNLPYNNYLDFLKSHPDFNN